MTPPLDTLNLNPARLPVPATPGVALPNPVLWSEGMLLSPQHLQQNDVYSSEQLRFALAQLLPHAWGIARLELDPVKLAQQVLSIKRLEGLLPDGTAVAYPSPGLPVLELDFKAALAASPKGLRISLVLPQRMATSAAMDASLRRYDPAPGSMAVDETTGLGVVPVDRMIPRLSLWAGASIPQQYSVCPLLELQLDTQSQQARLSSYHPPLLRWGAADFLGPLSLRHILQNLSEQIWQKLRELAGPTLQADGPLEAAGLSEDARQRLALAQRLAQGLPGFSLAAERADATALETYQALVQLVGHMSGFGSNPIPPRLGPYEHSDAAPQFLRAVEYVLRKLEGIQTQHQFLPFERFEPGRFRRRLPTPLGRDILVELLLHDGQSPGPADRELLGQWLTHACIASADLQPGAAKARVSALVRPMTDAEAQRYKLRVGAALFVISNTEVTLHGLGAQHLMAAGQVLVIDGQQVQVGACPAAILLYQPRKLASA